MRTSSRAAHLRKSLARVTKHGRSAGPSSVAHSTAEPCSSATEVNVPHSCATNEPGSIFNSAPANRVTIAAEASITLISNMFLLLMPIGRYGQAFSSQSYAKLRWFAALWGAPLLQVHIH